MSLPHGDAPSSSGESNHVGGPSRAARRLGRFLEPGLDTRFPLKAPT